MRINAVRALMAVVAALVMTVGAVAQEGHPLTGTWYGTYGTAAQRHDATLIMKWDGQNVTGTLDPGPNASPLKSAVLDITPGKPAPEGENSTTGIPPIFKVRIDINGMLFEGTMQNPVAGNRTIVGTWTRGTEKGTFQLRRL
jgi:hypothetical protein